MFCPRGVAGVEPRTGSEHREAMTVAAQRAFVHEYVSASRLVRMAPRMTWVGSRDHGGVPNAALRLMRLCHRTLNPP